MRISIWLGVILALLGSAQLAWAARIIDAEILLLGGRVVLQSGTQDDGGAEPDRVWLYLKTAQFGGERGLMFVPDKDNPLRATLEGDITVRIWYGGSAKVNKLTLIRDRKTDSLWRIEPSQVEKLLQTRDKNWRIP